MTKKRMLAMVNSKCLVKFLEATELSKSVFPRSFKFRKNQEIDDQHSKPPVLQKQTDEMRNAFQAKEFEKQNPQQLITYISNMLYLENKHFIDSSFLFFVDPVIEDKVDSDLRDYTVKNLQIMNKVFFELPIDIFVKTAALVDRFISRVKVKPKYMSCVATACLYLAAKTAPPLTINCPSLETLSQLSKCGGTVDDLERMVEIIMVKLNHNFDFVTSYDFLDFFYKVRASERLSSWSMLQSFLETAQTSLKVCYQKPSVVALACLLVNPRGNDMTFVKTMSLACKVELKQVTTTAEIIAQSYRSCYNRQPSSRNSLVWAISKRTLSNIYGASPTTLATISEEVCSCTTVNSANDHAFCNENWTSSLNNLFELKEI